MKKNYGINLTGGAHTFSRMGPGATGLDSEPYNNYYYIYKFLIKVNGNSYYNPIEQFIRIHKCELVCESVANNNTKSIRI